MSTDIEIVKTNTPPPDGYIQRNFRPQLTGVLHLPVGDRSIKISMDANAIYAQVMNAINKMLRLGVEDGENKALAMLIKTAVKGVLLLYGPRIIAMQWIGEGKPPKPGKDDDILLWYSDYFTRQFIAAASLGELHMEGGAMENEDACTVCVRVDAVSTRSTPGTES
jgi:hypothetical protein